MKQLYQNSINSSNSIVYYKEKCPGNPILLANNKGKTKNKSKYMICGGQSLLVYCALWYNNFFLDANKNRLYEDFTMFGAIDTKQIEKYKQ